MVVDMRFNIVVAVDFDEPSSDRGIGRVYHPFTASQLSAALRKEFVYPGSTPPGLLPSFTAAPPPAINEHLQYLDQANASQTPAPGARAVVSPSVPPLIQTRHPATLPVG